jgi:hypothetical protein
MNTPVGQTRRILSQACLAGLVFLHTSSGGAETIQSPQEIADHTIGQPESAVHRTLCASLPTGERVQFDLTPFDTFSPGATIVVQTAAGRALLPPQGTFCQATISGRHAAAGTVRLLNGTWEGFVHIDGSDYRIIAASGSEARLERLKPEEGAQSAICGVGAEPEHVLPNSSLAQTDCGLSVATMPVHSELHLNCDVGIACDNALYGAFLAAASNNADAALANLKAYVQLLFATVSSNVYDQDPILHTKLRLSWLEIWNEGDPFPPSDLASTELANFSSFWNGSAESSAPRRIMVLLSGHGPWKMSSTDLTGSVYGNSNPGSLCDLSSAYLIAHVASTGPGVGSQDLRILAHELGHIFGSRHTFNCIWGSVAGLGYVGGDSLLDNYHCTTTPPRGACTEEGACLCYDNSDPENPVLINCPVVPPMLSLMYPFGGAPPFHPVCALRNRQEAELAGLPADTVSDLLASSTCTMITLTWTAPMGPPQEYDLRTSTQPVTAATFAAATQIPVGAPGPSGAAESFTWTIGSCSRQRYFALKWRDVRNQWSGISNSAQGATPCLQCDDGGAAPRSVVTELELGIPSPSPARDRIAVSFAIPADLAGLPYDLTLYDVAGRRLHCFERGLGKEGPSSGQWNLVRDQAQAVGAGVYFLRLTSGLKQLTRAVVVVR